MQSLSQRKLQRDQNYEKLEALMRRAILAVNEEDTFHTGFEK